MSMPPSRARSGSYSSYTWNPYNGLPQPTVTTTNISSNGTTTGVRKVSSSSSAKVKTAFPVRYKTWTYKGRVYTRQAGWIFPPKKPKIRGSQWRAPTAYSATLEEGDLTHFNGTVGWVNKGRPEIHGVEVGDLPFSSARPMGAPAIPSFDSGLESRAVVKALSKLKDQKVNLAVAMAERAETAELLIGTLAGLAKAARSLRRGDMRGVARGLGLSGSPKAPKGQSFPQKWLELQYGWQPLYSDVFGAVSALHGADQADPERYTTTVTGSVKTKHEYFTNPVSGKVSTCAVFARSREMEGCFVRLDYYLENPFLASLSSLGITNPVEVLWERVPFSFVIDWFLPVGNYLSSMDAALGYAFKGGSCSRLFRRDWESWVAPGSEWAGNIPGTVVGTARCRQLKLARSIYSSSPLPRVPSFKNPFPQGSTHIANAIALFASSLRG